MPSYETVLSAVAAHPGTALLATDFDGVLAPIVADPEHSRPLPETVAALARLGRRLGQLVIITGRPARVAVRLGGLASVPGLERLVVLGQYGVERWDAATGRYDEPEPPAAVAEVLAALPDVLAAHGWPEAAVEDKGRAVGVHTRRLSDPQRAFDELRGPLEELARSHGLHLEPGKLVLEIRPPGMDKGAALRRIVAETGAATVLYAGDDLGDLAAFEAVRALGESGGRQSWSVFVAADAEHSGPEQEVLAAAADLTVDGPAGFASWLADLADLVDRPDPSDRPDRPDRVAPQASNTRRR